MNFVATPSIPMNSQYELIAASTNHMKRYHQDKIDVPVFDKPMKKARMMASPEKASAKVQYHKYSKEVRIQKLTVENVLTHSSRGDTISFKNNNNNNSSATSFLSTYPMIHRDFINPITGVNTNYDYMNHHTTNTTTDLDGVELQIEFLRTLKKLNKSIHRSDQSRMMVQKLHYSTMMRKQSHLPKVMVADTHNNHNNNHNHNNRNHHHSNDFFYYGSPQWNKTEQHRKQLTKIVSHDCLYRTVF